MSGLKVRGMRKCFGGVVALDGVDLEVPGGQVSALIGPNGAGKTTLFDCVTGRTAPDAGTVVLGGRDLTGQGVDARARAGLGRTFQRLEVFAGMTVIDNVLVAAERAATPLAALRQPAGAPLPSAQHRAVHALERLGIAHLAHRTAGDLPTGKLRLVELARALAAEPAALLLDEPASGLDGGELDSLRRTLGELAQAGLAVLLVEHDVDLVMDVSAEVHVIAFGRVVAHGPPAVVAGDPVVRDVYLASPLSGGPR